MVIGAIGLIDKSNLFVFGIYFLLYTLKLQLNKQQIFLIDISLIIASIYKKL